MADKLNLILLLSFIIIITIIYYHYYYYYYYLLSLLFTYHYYYYHYYLLLFFSQHPSLFGENGANIPTIVSIIANCFSQEVLGSESAVKPRMKACIAALQV